MRFDWSTLDRPPPTGLVGARKLAHHAVQWATKAARANLKATPDDSHSSLDWDAGHAALLSQPLPAGPSTGGPGNDAVRVGLRIAGLELIVVRGGEVLDLLPLDGIEDATAGSWTDSTLHGFGLLPASKARLPYVISDHAVASGAPYEIGPEARALEELSRWYDGAADALGAVAARLAGLRPGPGPVRCWPHHFDIATLVALDEGHAETSRSIGIGVSPGDEYYAQPYAYISPWPNLDAANLPGLPPPGHWHTRGFVAAVATGEEILALGERGRGLLAFIAGAVEIGRARLKA